MEKGNEREQTIPFKISFDKEIDWTSLTIRLQFKENLLKNDRKKIENTLGNWSEKEIEKGNMQYLDDEAEWNEEKKWVEFWADFGGYDEKIALDNLFNKLSEFKSIEEVKLGSGYAEW